MDIYSTDNTRRLVTKAVPIIIGSVILSPVRTMSGVIDWFTSKSNQNPVKGIPESWIKAKGIIVNEYGNYILSLNLKNITPRQVIAPHFKTRGRIHNTLPPKDQWNNIGKTLKIADKLCVKMEAPLKEVLSAYRSPKYNRAVGGKSRSYHMKNNALDLRYKGVSASHVNYVTKQLRKNKEFKGGIGRYPSFTHIDTRGENVSW